MGNGTEQSRAVLPIFSNQSLWDYEIPVILSTIYITKEKIGSVKIMLPPGLYEQVINTALNCAFSDIPDARKSVAPIDKAEASKIQRKKLTLLR